MHTRLFDGELVRLAAPNPETDAETVARWTRDSEYWRLMDSGPAGPRPAVRIKERLSADPKDSLFLFYVRALADDRLLGRIDVEVDYWPHGEGWVGIDIGDRAEWGKGYGTDAMRVMLRYVFTELNLHRVSLNVFAYNPRAIRSYEKAGFVVEGRRRQALNRDGRRRDIIHMGILREEWVASSAVISGVVISDR